jgi:hypothetical protein
VRRGQSSPKGSPNPPVSQRSTPPRTATAANITGRHHSLHCQTTEAPNMSGFTTAVSLMMATNTKAMPDTRYACGQKATKTSISTTTN